MFDDKFEHTIPTQQSPETFSDSIFAERFTKKQVRFLIDKSRESITDCFSKKCSTFVTPLNLYEIVKFMKNSYYSDLGKVPFGLSDYEVRVKNPTDDASDYFTLKFHAGNELFNDYLCRRAFRDKLKPIVGLANYTNECRMSDPYSITKEMISGYYFVEINGRTYVGIIYNRNNNYWYQSTDVDFSEETKLDISKPDKHAETMALIVNTYIQYCYAFKPKKDSTSSESMKAIDDFVATESKESHKQNPPDYCRILIDMRPNSKAVKIHDKDTEIHRKTYFWVVLEHDRHIRTGKTKVKTHIKGPGRNTPEALAYLEECQRRENLTEITIKT